MNIKLLYIIIIYCFIRFRVLNVSWHNLHFHANISEQNIYHFHVTHMHELLSKRSADLERCVALIYFAYD